jgi:hypothetical protein
MASPPPRALTRRILFRLADAELRERNPHFRDDYRIAWITVFHAARGDPQPDVTATYAVLGIHPNKLWPAIVARRKALLGTCYADFWGEALPPKKPAQSVKIAARRAA